MLYATELGCRSKIVFQSSRARSTLVTISSGQVALPCTRTAPRRGHWPERWADQERRADQGPGAARRVAAPSDGWRAGCSIGSSPPPSAGCHHNASDCRSTAVSSACTVGPGSTPSSSASIDRILRTASSASPCRPDRTSASQQRPHRFAERIRPHPQREFLCDGRFLTERDSQQGQILDSDEPQTGSTWTVPPAPYGHPPARRTVPLASCPAPAVAHHAGFESCRRPRRPAGAARRGRAGSACGAPRRSSKRTPRRQAASSASFSEYPSVEVTTMVAGVRAARPGSSARRRPAT